MDLNNKTLLIFDLDGTLVDTAPDFKNSLNYMLTEMGEETVESVSYTHLTLPTKA